MDHRIAANWTREGIKGLQQNALKSEATVALLISAFYRSLHGKQKLSYSQVSKVVGGVCSRIASQPHNVFLDRFGNARISKQSRRFDALFLGSSFETPEAPPSREHESALQFRLFQGRFGRKQFSMNHLLVPVYMRNHAIQRYIERTDLAFEDAIKDTGPTILFVMGLPLTKIGHGMAVPFMTPARNGAFFGVQIPGEPSLAEVSSISIDAQGHHQDERTVPSLTHLRKTYINTFVSKDELREEQLALCEQLQEFLDAHREMLMIYAMEHVIDADFTFPGVVGDRPEAMTRDIRLITSGNLWKATVTPPSESVFQEYFEEQKRVDRYGVKTLLAAHGIDYDDAETMKEMMLGSGADPAVIEAIAAKLK